MRLRALILLLPILFAIVLAPPPAFAQTPSEAELDALNNRAAALRQAGKYSEAIPLVRQYQAGVKALYGENSSKYAAAVYTLAQLAEARNHLEAAESLYRDALAIFEKTSGPEHPDAAAVLNSLGVLLKGKNRLAEAEPLYRRAIAIWEKSLAPDDPKAAAVLNNLALLLRGTNRLAEAEPLYRRAIAIWEKNLGPDHPNVASTSGNLADLLWAAKRPEEAEPLYRRALAIDEKSLGPDHPNVARRLDSLALVLWAANHMTEAEPLMRRALAIKEKQYGADHPNIARDLYNLARFLEAGNRLTEAEPLLRRALAIDEKRYGPDHPEVGKKLNDLALLLRAMIRLAEAEPLYRRALAISEKSFGPDHPNVATNLANLAVLLTDTNRRAEAEPLMRRVLAIDEKNSGPDHPNTASALNNLATLLSDTNRVTEAEPLLRRALAIKEKSYGPEHLEIAGSLNNLALLLKATNRRAEAEPLMRRALAIKEKHYGRGHTGISSSLNNLALLLGETDRLAEAEPLLRRALAIDEKSLGPDHPHIAATLTNLSVLLDGTNRQAETEPLLRRTLAIWERSLGPDHPNVARALGNLAVLFEAQGRWPDAVALYRKAKPIMTGIHGGGGQQERGLEKVIVAQNTYGLRSYARALYRAGAGNAANRAEGFEAAQWALQNRVADALSAMAARFAKDGQGLGQLVREEQDLLNAREAAYRSLDVAAGKADAGAAEAARAAIADIETRLKEKQAALRQDFPNYAELTSPKPLPLAEAQALLGEGDALVLFLDLPDSTHIPGETVVFALTKKEARWTSASLSTQSLQQRVTALRCGLDSSNWRAGKESRENCKELLGTEVTEEQRPPFDTAAAHALYRDLFGGIEDLIQGKQLLIVPAGALTKLPFEVLVTARPDEALPRFEAYKTAAWLGQRQAITILPSAGSLKALRTARGSAAPEPFAGFGNPLLTGEDGTDRSAWAKQDCSKTAPQEQSRIAGVAASIMSLVRGGAVNIEDLRRQPPLPETADELCSVGRELGVPETGLNKVVHLGGQATVAQVKALSRSGDLARVRMVHFATHGLLAGETAMFAKNKAEPALLLTPPGEASEEDNGLLTASEVALLNLNADWVVMSACNTAGGSAGGAEALPGLAGAFFYSGARSLLVSHWYVDSQTAVAITTGAVNAMMATPQMSRAGALRSSTAAVIARGGRYAHPSVWAPFVLVGNGEQ
jgi:CHAT domain-containing protein